jgi:sugar/nucleoside kinase (ribokinase family)
MMEIRTLGPIDYLTIGHLTLDIRPEGQRLGGTAAYATLTAKALGLKVGMVTSWGSEIPLGPLGAIPVYSFPAEESTKFENIYHEGTRAQRLHSVAEKLDFYQIPEPWRSAKIIHLGPVAQEVAPAMVRQISTSLLGITPQGWLRSWDSQGEIYVTEWPEAGFVLGHAGAAVISIEDVQGDEERIEEMAVACPVLAVTEGADGVRVYWNGDVRRFRSPEVDEVDPTGAGDIFAAAFFVRLYTTRDPWEAARFATQLSAISVTRVGLAGIPTPEEVNTCMVEVL